MKFEIKKGSVEKRKIGIKISRVFLIVLKGGENVNFCQGEL